MPAKVNNTITIDGVKYFYEYDMRTATLEVNNVGNFQATTLEEALEKFKAALKENS